MSRRNSIALVLLVAIGGFGFSATSAGETLNNEQIVRLFVSGVPVEQILEEIRTADVDFDLSEEMLDELRIAGLPPEIVGAMRARGGPAVTRDVPGAAPETLQAKLVLRLDGSRFGGETPALKMLDPISPETAETLGLPSGERRFADLAMFVVCRTADHVPDHWRGKSPLGRDFGLMPRHEMLAFVAGAEKIEAGKLQALSARLVKVAGAQEEAREASALRLELPATIELELTPFVAHDLAVGVAARAADRYYALMIDNRDGVIVEEGTVELRLELESGDGSPAQLTVRFAEP